ncbi:MAG TPA: hypothetical protein VH349_04805 [Ktedonobacterales bacterium]|jgi:hypothetical protein
MKARRIWQVLLAPIMTVLAICMVSTTAFAAQSPKATQPAPPVGGFIDTDPATANNADQDPKFVALKNAYRINSGVQLGQGKGASTTPYVMDTPMNPNQMGPRAVTSGVIWQNCTNCAELGIYDVIKVFEPGNGAYPNYGWGTPGYDDDRIGYGDANFWNLCGPGAADNVTWYWPNPLNYLNASATDYYPNPDVTTYWSGKDVYDNVYRNRGFMVQLAWNTNPIKPDGTYAWTYNGMMQRGQAASDTKMKEGINWEISGHNRNTWQNAFYVVAPSSQGQSRLHGDIVSDILGAHVPVAILLNAGAGLPNWQSGVTVHHWITIIGYNDDNHQYAYTDTCAQSTHCNDHGQNFQDGGVYIANQDQVWSAVNSYGDWIW